MSARKALMASSTYRRVTAVVAIACVAAVVAACGSPAGPAGGEAGGDGGSGGAGSLNALYFATDVQVSPVFFAQDQGLYEANDVDVALSLSSGQNQIAALAAHQADIAFTGSAGTLGPNAGGADIVTIMTISPVYNWRFYARPEIQDMSQLRGRTVGITAPGASFDVGMRLALPTYGLTANDVTFISAGNIDNVLAALVSGGIDSAPLIVGPATVEAENKGFRELFDFADLDFTLPLAAILTTRTAIEEKPEAIQAFVNAVTEALDLLRTDKEKATAFLTQFTGLDEASIEEIYTYFVDEVWVEPIPTREQFETIIPITAEQDPRILDLDIDQQFDASFVENALEARPWSS